MKTSHIGITSALTSTLWFFHIQVPVQAPVVVHTDPAETVLRLDTPTNTDHIIGRLIALNQSCDLHVGDTEFNTYATGIVTRFGTPDNATMMAYAVADKDKFSKIGAKDQEATCKAAGDYVYKNGLNGI